MNRLIEHVIDAGYAERVLTERQMARILGGSDDSRHALVKRAVNLAKGSAEPNRNKVGKITRKQIEEIAKIKMPDLNSFDLEGAMSQVEGACKSMGVEIAN